MNRIEWEKLIESLNLSFRTRNLLMRIDSERIKNYQDLLGNIDITKKIKGFGIHSFNELREKLEEKCREQKSIKGWKSISDGLPVTGVPLMVETCNSFDKKISIKYPVYYAKDPYDLNYMCTKNIVEDDRQLSISL